jgi:hypothetical protein
MCSGAGQFMVAELIITLAINNHRAYLLDRDPQVRINAQLVGDPEQVTGLGYYY